LDINSKQNGIVVLGGGLAGLSAGYVLSREGKRYW